jgi:DNA-binding response OmpR family regulator
MPEGRLFLIHWNLPEAEAYAETLRGWGWEVDFEYEDGARGGKAIKENPPDAVVIYHTRLPSHGRATAEYVAEAKATREIPFIFVGGQGEALDKTKAKIPGATFIEETDLKKTLDSLAGEP